MMSTNDTGPGILGYRQWPLVRYSILIAAVAGASLFMWPGLLRNLFSEDFMPHGACLLWEPKLLWLHIASDTSIGLSYVAISFTLAWLVHRARKDIPFQWVFLAFGLFIIACGSTHFMEVVTLWRPFYWLSGDVKLVTAIASVATAVVLPPLVPKTIAMIQAAKLSDERKVRIEAQNRDLEEMTHKLRELDELKTHFFANVSHELRTPLALMLGRTEKLLSSNQLDPGTAQDLKLVHRNARSLLKQVNDLLDISKLEAGRMGLEYSRVDLARFVRREVANFDSLASDRHVSYVYRGPDTLQAEVDTDKFERILLNLLSNAFKFTPDGGQIRCELATEDGGAVLTVADSGPGIKPELRQAVFERFRQLEGGTTRRFGGTGLGLAIVKDFVDMHKGSVDVCDAPEGGAQFTVRIPLSAPKGEKIGAQASEPKNDSESRGAQAVEELQASNAEVQGASEVEGALSSAPLILVVEDNAEMNRFIVESLAGEYRVASALDGRSGVDKALSLKPDLVLSDIMMPEMSGEDLLRELRSRPQFEFTPVILLTARADPSDRVRVLRAGAQDYIMKPFSVEELRVRVRNLASLSQTRKVLQEELNSQTHDVEQLAQEVSVRRRELDSALEALRVSESRFRRLVESNVIGVITSRLDGSIVEANDAFLHMTGYTREDLEAGRLNWKRMTPPDYAEADAAAVQQLYRVGVVPAREKEYTRADGSRVPVLVGAARTEGEKSAAIAFVLDLTEQKRGEAALRESEQRFRTVVEAMPQIVWTSRPDGFLDFYNQRWYDYTGLGYEETKGWGWQSVIHPDDLQLCLDRWAEAVQTGKTYQIQYRFRRHDGQFRWHLGRAVPLRHRNGEILKWFGTSTDIDDQKRAEAAKGELAAIVESSDDAIIGKTLDGRITSWNRGAERIYGYTVEEAVGQPIWMLSPPERMEEISDIMGRVARGEKIEHLQTVRIRKDQRRIDVSLSVSLVRNVAGEVIGASTIARDITELRRAENALRNSEKHATVGRLAATMAHEINNPLEAVSNVLYLLGTRSDLDEEAKQYVSIAGQEMDRIAHIVKQTLGFYRESMAPVQINMPELVDNVLSLYSRKIQNKSITVEKRVGPVSEVPGYPAEMRQVFSNIVINAIEAMPDAGKLTIHIYSCRDWSDWNRCGVRLVICDTGSGISPENRRNLFEPFFTTKGEKGTGLGLWVSYGIVQKHGGKIHVRSSIRPGQSGTCFSILLPSEVPGTLVRGGPAPRQASLFYLNSNG